MKYSFLVFEFFDLKYDNTILKCIVKGIDFCVGKTRNKNIFYSTQFANTQEYAQRQSMCLVVLTIFCYGLCLSPTKVTGPKPASCCWEKQRKKNILSYSVLLVWQCLQQEIMKAVSQHDLQGCQGPQNLNMTVFGTWAKRQPLQNYQ